MVRLIILSSLFFISCLVLANKPASLYQVDIIVFTHLQAARMPVQNSDAPLLAPDTQQAVPLQMSMAMDHKPYHLLPSSTSDLRTEYRALSRKPQYQLLFHYTWLQPSNNQQAVSLSPMNTLGWNVEGTLRIRRSHYYLLDTDLFFSDPNNTQAAFLFSLKQRLKPDVVYYLDHPQAGLLIKVHQLT